MPTIAGCDYNKADMGRAGDLMDDMSIRVGWGYDGSLLLIGYRFTPIS